MEVLPVAYSTENATRARAPLPASALHTYSAPASQESIASIDSIASSHYQHTINSSSNVSQLTNATEYSTLDPYHRTPVRIDTTRARTPEDQGDLSLASPMSITSPTRAIGSKRTASGHVKNSLSYSGAPLKSAFSPHRSRAESMSSTGSRAGELAASLKTRLSYAMAKVQHGWETKTITELEHLPVWTPSHRHSLSESRPMTARSAAHPVYGQLDTVTSPPYKRRSGHFGVSSPPADRIGYNASMPHLQPPADIYATQHMSAKTSHHRQHSYAMSPPRTPYTARRPPVIRTDTQTAEAEREALQALTQLGSPHNPQYVRQHSISQTTSSQTSPIRTDFVPLHMITLARSDSDSSNLASTSDYGHADDLRTTANLHMNGHLV